VFTQGILWGLNSFDQPGVERGKKLAQALKAGGAASGKEEAFLAELFQTLSFSSKK